MLTSLLRKLQNLGDRNTGINVEKVLDINTAQILTLYRTKTKLLNTV